MLRAIVVFDSVRLDLVQFRPSHGSWVGDRVSLGRLGSLNLKMEYLCLCFVHMFMFKFVELTLLVVFYVVRV